MDSRRAGSVRWEWSDDEMDALIEVRRSGCPLGRGTPYYDSELLRSCLEEVFVSTPEIRAVLRRLVSYALAHFDLLFVDPLVYMKGIYSPDPWKDYQFPAICVHGLGGVGKSELRKGFFRLVGGTTTRDLAGHRGMPITRAWPISLRDGTSWSALLRPHLDAGERWGESDEDRKRDLNVHKVIKSARKQSWRDCTCLLWADEFQLVSYSGEASAKATGILHGLLGIGPRLAFTTNFSLLHALTRRPQQDTQRFLSLPVLIDPEKRGSANAVALLEAYRDAVGAVLAFDIQDAEPIVHGYTYGIKRNIVNLLTKGYLIAREDGRGAIQIDDLHAAYASDEMRMQRTDVGILFRQDVAMAQIRADLWNPLGISRQSAVGTSSTVTDAGQAKERFEAQVETDLLLDTLLPEQAEALRSLDSTLRPEPKTPGKVVSMRRNKVTRESLAKGILDFSR